MRAIRPRIEISRTALGLLGITHWDFLDATQKRRMHYTNPFHIASHYTRSTTGQNFCYLHHFNRKIAETAYKSENKSAIKASLSQ